MQASIVPSPDEAEDPLREKPSKLVCLLFSTEFSFIKRSL